MSRNSALLNNTIILAIGQFVPKIIALVTIPLLTGYMTTADYGIYELTLSVACFCIPLLSVQIQQAAFRYLIDPDSDKKTIISSSLSFIMISFAIFCIPISIGWYLFIGDFTLGFIFFCAYFAETLLTWGGQVTRGFGDNFTYSLSYIIYSVVFLIGILCTFISLNKIPVHAVGITIVLSYLISFLYVVVRKKIFKNFSLNCVKWNYVKILLGYSAPMLISSIGLWTVNLSDRFFVAGFLGVEITALYAVANKIPNLFTSLYGVFNLAWTENASRLTETEKKTGYYSVFFNDFYNVIAGMLGVLICFTPLLFKLLVRNYQDAYSLMSWLYVGVFFSSIVAFFGSIYVGEKKTKNVGISSVVGAVINILINVLLIEKFGVIVAAISTIVAFFSISCYRAYDIKKYVEINYNYKNLIRGFIFIVLLASLNNSFSMETTFISIAVTFLFNAIYNKDFLRKIIKMTKQKITKRGSSNV